MAGRYSALISWPMLWNMANKCATSVPGKRERIATPPVMLKKLDDATVLKSLVFLLRD
jgi:hypothetical protein